MMYQNPFQFMSIVRLPNCIHRYINGVKPGQYGVPKPFYFPCLPSYWSGAPRRAKTVEVRYLTLTTTISYDILICLQPRSNLTEDSYSSSNHEEVSNDLKVGISIRNLTKIYGQVIIIFIIILCST